MPDPIEGRAIESEPKPKPSPKSPGPAPALSPSDLDKLAEVTGADVDKAAGYWGKLAEPEFRGLIDAKPDRPKPPAKS